MIGGMLSNKKLNPVVTELFIRGRNLNNSIIFIAQSNFSVPKTIEQILDIILSWNFQTNESDKFVREICKKISFNHSIDFDFKDFINLYKSIC